MRKIILIALFGAMFFGCSDEETIQKQNISEPAVEQEKAQESKNNIVAEVKMQNILDDINKTLQNGLVAAALATDKIIEKSAQIIDEGKNITDKIIKSGNEIIESGNEMIKLGANATTELTSNINKLIYSTIKPTSNNISVQDESFEEGKKVYRKCLACHGTRANTRALNKSEDISNWKKENIIDAMNGYKNGTYGGVLKSTMTSLLKTLSDEDINNVSYYIVNIDKN